MPAEAEAMPVTQDGALGGRLRLRQPRRGHRFGHDAILLAAATPARAGDHAVEFGAGVGVAGLALCLRVPGVRASLIEADAQLARLAAANATANAMADRVRVAAFDVTASARVFREHGLAPGSAQRVLMNPPFNARSTLQASPDEARAAAHLAAPASLAAWCRSALRLLAPGGSLTLVWRADGLAEVLAALGKGFGMISVLPVHPRPATGAIRILVNAVKGSRGPLAIRPALVLAGADGAPTPEAEAVLRHLAAIDVAPPSPARA
ncbi:MAG: methyltransferase [Variibacter sp.]|nr:methyltransferase [Variibacter sp.]